MAQVTRATVYFEPGLHKALRLKAAHTGHSLSELVIAAVRRTLAEDAEDLATFERRAKEPTLSLEAVLEDMKRRGNLVARIRSRANAPRPPGSEKLSGEQKYRIRQGDYRILSLIEGATSTVTIVRVAHRRDVYRNRRWTFSLGKPQSTGTLRRSTAMI